MNTNFDKNITKIRAGLQVEDLTVLHKAPANPKSKIIEWICLDSNGEYCTCAERKLQRKVNNSFIKRSENGALELTGKIFGKYKVIGKTLYYKKTAHRPFWLCVDAYNNYYIKTGDSLFTLPYQGEFVITKAQEEYLSKMDKKTCVNSRETIDNKPNCILDKNNDKNNQKNILQEKNNSKDNDFDSSEEEYIYCELCKIYGFVRHHFKDESRYNHECDFYVPDRDLFIEYNGYYTHGPEELNLNNEDHRNLIKKYHKKGYDKAIYTWAVDDKIKFADAKKNNLNYIAMYRNDYKQWLEFLREIEED